MENINAWAQAIAARLVDESAMELDTEDAELLRGVLEKALCAVPDETAKLIGTRVIEEGYFDRL